MAINNKINNITKGLILDLYEINAIKFGEFKLKSGIISPIYLDLRLCISYPKILGKIAAIMWKQVKLLQFDVICGVPYTAIPFATIIATTHNIPMVMCRKESKQHGTKKIIEGYFQPGQTCLLVEDLITSGSSILETIAPLKEAGLIVKNIVVLIDREQNGKTLLESGGYNIHAAFTLGQMLKILQHKNKLDTTTFVQIKKFIQEHQFQK
jgi:uridine monophosphate synthetase